MMMNMKLNTRWTTNFAPLGNGQMIMKANTRHRSRHSSSGFSLFELMIVIAILATFLVLAVPNYISARRLSRARGIVKEIASQLRQTRQEALGQSRAVSFQYNNQTKQMSVIRHATACRTSGPWPCPLLTDANYPNNGVVVRTVSLTGNGVAASDISYGRPANAPTTPLGDNATLTALTAAGTINITFQPDGSVINQNGIPVDTALFLFNVQSPVNTAAAISVLGAAGRVKIWSYSSDANKYVE